MLPTFAECPVRKYGEPHFLLLTMILSHPHSQSSPPNFANLEWWQSIWCRLFLRMRPFSERTSHSTMMKALSLSPGQRTDFHSLSIFCSKISSLCWLGTRLRSPFNVLSYPPSFPLEPSDLKFLHG